MSTLNVILGYVSSRLCINESLNSLYSCFVVALGASFDFPMTKLVLVSLKLIRFDVQDSLSILLLWLWSGAVWIMYNMSIFEFGLQGGGDKIVTSV